LEQIDDCQQQFLICGSTVIDWPFKARFGELRSAIGSAVNLEWRKKIGHVPRLDGKSRHIGQLQHETRDAAQHARQRAQAARLCCPGTYFMLS
jgi:hypothetical protein